MALQKGIQYTGKIVLSRIFKCINLIFFLPQACEQLNAWLSGFQTVLNRMTDANFNWYLHTLLHMHSMRVMQKIADKEAKQAKTSAKDPDAAEAEVEVDDVNLDVNIE